MYRFLVLAGNSGAEGGLILGFQWATDDLAEAIELAGSMMVFFQWYEILDMKHKNRPVVTYGVRDGAA